MGRHLVRLTVVVPDPSGRLLPRPLTGGSSGSAVSPLLSGGSILPGTGRPSPAPAPEAQIACSLFPGPPPDGFISVKSGLYPGRFTSRFGVRRYSRIAGPHDGRALSQITFKGPGCFSFSCFEGNRGARVGHPFHPFQAQSPSITAEVAGLLPVAGTGGLHQANFPRNSASARKWASSAEYPGPCPLGLLPPILQPSAIRLKANPTGAASSGN